MNQHMHKLRKALDSKDRERLIETIAEIVGSKEQVLFAYIFGSFSRGEQFRDIDVGVYLSDGSHTSTLHDELELESELEAACRVPVDARIMNNAPLTFVYHILKSAIVIVDKDGFRRSDYEGLIYKEYFDVLHLRREYLREMVHASV